MQFQKKINNSVAWALNDEGESVIVLGKGIAFGKTKGQELDLAEINRVFKPEELENNKKNALQQAIDNISSDLLMLTEEISKMAAKSLKIAKFDENHFLALTDHLNHALKQSNIDMVDYPENMRWEVRKMYPKEYDVAIDALYLIEKKTGIRLPKSEQTFLTYHFVNAQYDSSIKVQSMQLADLINRSMEVIQYHYQCMLNQNSVSYIRFVTHLRYFILRQLHQEEASKVPVVNQHLLDGVRLNYRKAFQAAEKVGNLLLAQTTREVNEEELFYLTLHIERVTHNES